MAISNPQSDFIFPSGRELQSRACVPLLGGKTHALPTLLLDSQFLALPIPRLREPPQNLCTRK